MRSRFTHLVLAYLCGHMIFTQQHEIPGGPGSGISARCWALLLHAGM